MKGLKCMASKTKVAIIGITESRLEHAAHDLKANLPRCDIPQRDRNRSGGGAVCYIRKDLCFNTRTLRYKNIENVIFDILLRISKPVNIGLFYRPPIQTNLMELIIENFSHLNLENNKTYLLDDFNINFLRNKNYILNGKGTAACQAPVHTLTNKYLEFCQIFSLKKLINCPTRVTCTTSSSILIHFFTFY